MKQPTRKLYVTVDVSYGDIVVNAFQKVNMSNKHWDGEREEAWLLLSRSSIHWDKFSSLYSKYESWHVVRYLIK